MHYSADNPFAPGLDYTALIEASRSKWRAARNAVLRDTVVGWSVPSLLALLVTFTGRWVYRGFRGAE